ncbi:hypothetical protein CQA49_05435 [Helicobacter sp. MIT 00-7814]|uniref:CvpA family protein n=1 Tax=unclassified Helicobacter TaxID=2593540 RepID=UPI000E1EE3DE|nr:MULTISPECIES: CvpA family protein [unclassified Helicobacter]RDU54230.1 hypothetical protein CQA49_05435 [Helicobacter sp. MIT 00-7814]RDU56024.1 hypothetical protein CQA37_02985 [Helicobacter sp. MIT 99-10781]
MEQLSYIDVCLLLLSALLSVKSINQGFVRSFGSLLGLLLGIFLAARFYTQTSNVLSAHVFNFSPQINTIIAFLVVATIVYLLFVLLSEIIARWVQNTLAERLDKALGLIFGFCKSFALLAIIIFFLAQISFLQNFAQKAQSESFVYRLMQSFAHDITDFEIVTQTIESTGNAVQGKN